MSNRARSKKDVFESHGEHEFDAVELVDLAGAWVVVNGCDVGNAGAVISVGVAVGMGVGVTTGVEVGVGVGDTSITGVGSGSFCRFALQDTTNTMIAITNSRQAPPTMRSLVRLSNCSMCVVLSISNER